MNDKTHGVVSLDAKKGTVSPKSKVKITFWIDYVHRWSNVESFELNVAYMTRVEQVLINTISNFNETRNPEMDKSVYGSINKL